MVLALLLRFLCGSLLPCVLGHCADVGVQVGYCADSFGAALPEDKAHVGFEILWVFDEAEPHQSLVSGPQVSLCHLDDGSCLSNAAYMHCEQVDRNKHLEFTVMCPDKHWIVPYESILNSL